MMEKSTSTSRNNRKIMRKSTLVIFFGILVMSSLTVYIVSKSPTLKESLEAERPVERETLLHLAVLEKKAANEFIPILGRVNPNSQLVFEVSSNVPVHVTLFAETSGRMPKALFEYARVPPGKGKRLGKGAKHFVFEAQSERAVIKFCLVQGNNAEALQAKLHRIKDVWSHLPETQCVKVNFHARSTGIGQPGNRA